MSDTQALHATSVLMGKAPDEAAELKDQRVVVMMSQSELQAIDDWMFANRLRSRGEAIRRLCMLAQAAAGSA